ncbi:hypothetical protein ACHWQZ_G018186 [Mnemiopsis leidyi]
MLTAYFLTEQFYQVRMSLPPEWQIRHSKSRGGRVYYFSKLTNETRWDCPVAEVDDDEYPELILPDDVKNDTDNNNNNNNTNNKDACKKPDNSPNPPGRTHLNKRRRVDRKRSNSDVKPSTMPEKGKQKSLPADKRKDKQIKWTKLSYREACLSDLNAYLGGGKSLQEVGTKQRDTPPSGGNVSSHQTKSRDQKTENKTRDKKQGSDLVGPGPASWRESKTVPPTARLRDLKTYLEQRRGTGGSSVHSNNSGQNTQAQKLNNRGPTKTVEPSKSGQVLAKSKTVDSSKSGPVSTKLKDDKSTERKIKSSPYMRPNKLGLSKEYKIPKVTTKKDDVQDRKSRSEKQLNKTVKILSAGKFPEPRSESEQPLTKPTYPSPKTVPSKRQCKSEDTPPPKKVLTSKPSPEKVSRETVSPTSGSLIGKIASSSWNFLKRTFSTGALAETSHPQSSGSDGCGQATTMISPQTQGQISRAGYSDDEYEMMEIDEVIATVSEIRTSIHNSQSDLDCSLLAETETIGQEGEKHIWNRTAGQIKERLAHSWEDEDEERQTVQTFYVLDTNVLIHDLPFVEMIVQLSERESVSIVIPWIVLQELDGLKSASNVGKAARKAIDYLLEYRKSRREGIVFEPNSKVRTEVADDRILLCLDWISNEGEDIDAILVSCDKNLRLKADVTGYHSYDVSELRTLLGSSDGDITDVPRQKVRGRLRMIGLPAKPEPEFTTPVKPRRPKSTSTSSPQILHSTLASPQIQATTTSSLRIRHPSGGNNTPTIRHSNGRNSSSPSTAGVNSFHIPTPPPQNKNFPTRDNSNVTRSGSPGSPAPSFPIDKRLAHFTGEISPKPEPRTDIARFDKSVLQVLDEMNGSMTVFRQQVVTFVEAKLSVPGPGLTIQLTELQNFLSVLVPDVNRFLDSSRALNQVALSQLKNNFSAVVDLVSAIQSYSVHHLHYAPNIAANDVYQWLVEPGHLEHLTATQGHFTELLAEIERAVDALLTRKQFV